ncbi:MAG: PAS domain-containing protein [Pseudomonadota bacterium]
MDTLYEIDFEIIADRYPGSLSLADLTLPDSPLVAVNASFLAMTEYRDHEVIGRNCRFLSGSERSEEAGRLIKESIASRRPMAICLNNQKRSGECFNNLLFLSYIKTRDGGDYAIGAQNEILEQSWESDTERAICRTQDITRELAHKTATSEIARNCFELRGIAALVRSQITARRAARFMRYQTA